MAMDIELIAFGDSQVIQKIVSDYVYSEKNGVFLISVPRNLLSYTLSLLKSENIENMEYSQFVQRTNASCTNNEISKINSELAFQWFNSGNEFFCTTAGSSFEMHSIDKKNVKVVSSAEPISKCFMSNDGCIYGFIRGHSTSFHVGDDLHLFWDIKFDSAPTKILFSENSKFVAISTAEKTMFYNLFKGLYLGSIVQSEFYFVKNSIYLCDSDKLIDLNLPIKSNTLDIESLSIQPKGLPCHIYSGNKEAKFIVDGQLQKIIYKNGTETVKTHTNVKKIDFYFAESRLFAHLIKNPGENEHFSLESFCNSEITSNSFDQKVIQFSASDNYFAVQLENFETKFYIKEKHTFRLVNTFKKEGPVVISVKNYICCLFDTCSNSVEFYDRGELRTTFSHPGCTQIKWSESGMYVATFAYSASSGCLVQIFDCNGTLMFKKIYNTLKDLSWRSFPEISEDQKKQILSEHSLDEIEETLDDDTLKKKMLLKEWKDYLVSKMVSVN